ncbi:MAG: hypothetical protein ACLFTV_13075, partial [Desulfococcaceae bacterium]
FVLELNPLPGILPDPADNSCFPKAARTAGYDFNAMVNRVVDIAARRWGLAPAVTQTKTMLPGTAADARFHLSEAS